MRHRGIHRKVLQIHRSSNSDGEYLVIYQDRVERVTSVESKVLLQFEKEVVREDGFCYINSEKVTEKEAA